METGNGIFYLFCLPCFCAVLLLCRTVFGPPTAFPLIGPQCTVGVLAGTHWGAHWYLGRMVSGTKRQPSGCFSDLKLRCIGYVCARATITERDATNIFGQWHSQKKRKRCRLQVHKSNHSSCHGAQVLNVCDHDISFPDTPRVKGRGLSHRSPQGLCSLRSGCRTCAHETNVWAVCVLFTHHQLPRDWISRKRNKNHSSGTILKKKKLFTPRWRFPRIPVPRWRQAAAWLPSWLRKWRRMRCGRRIACLLQGLQTVDRACVGLVALDG